MITSMTGFAATTLTLSDDKGSQTQLSLMLKSLNSRFFEAHCKLPYALSHLETECIKLFKEKLHRGSVVLSIQANNPAIFKGPAQPELSIVKSYLNACNTIQNKFDISGTLTISDIITLPNIFAIEEQTVDETIKKKILDAIKQLLETLINARIAEGNALKKDLERRIAVMQQHINTIEKQAQSVMEKRKKEIMERLATLENNTDELTESQRNTLYFELDKIDIHEEIVRFQNHLENFTKQVHSSEIEKGRRLDFILQELAREINTIAAKCNDSQISAEAVNIKVEIEKAREQVQNIV